MSRADFGPPRNPVGAFGWAALQLPRAVLWQWRERELRTLTFVPALVTLAFGLAAVVAAVLGAGPLTGVLVAHGALAVLTRVVLTVVLLLAAALLTWQLQSALAAPALERMALYVQREVTGEAPVPTEALSTVLRKAVTGFFPSLRRIVAWALGALAGLTLVLVPVVGPVLVVVVQVALAAVFLAHQTITENRARLGLPRRLVLREPALVLGLAVACVPIFLVPGLMLFANGPVSIAGALVALGTRRREGLQPANGST